MTSISLYTAGEPWISPPRDSHIAHLARAAIQQVQVAGLITLDDPRVAGLVIHGHRGGNAAAFSSYSHSTVPSILFRAITVDLLALPVMFTVKITRPEMPF